MVKLAELNQGEWFTRGVAYAVERLAGPDAELASIVLEQDKNLRHVLVATPLGVVRCRLETDGPLPSRPAAPIVVSLVRWDQWPLLDVTVEVSKASPSGYATSWSVGGWPHGMAPGPWVDEVSLSEFVRECVARKQASSG